jgi:hypothetical protein
MKWNGDYSLYAEENLQKVLEKGIGDSGDINLMLVSLLRELGYEANPVILSTRNHGKVSTDFALLNHFNYVIAQVWVNGKDMLLDATEDFLSLGTLPQRCLNKQGWLIHPKNARWVTLTPNAKYGKYVGFNMAIGENQEMKGKVEIAYMGYAASDFRKELAQTSKEEYLKNYQKKFITWQDPKLEISNVEDLESAVKIDCQTTINESYTMAGNRIYLQPLLGAGMTANPFKLKERNYPIDFAYPTEESVMVSYTLPKGYEVEELPTNDALSLPENGGKFYFEIKQEGEQLKITSRVQVRKTVFEAESYPLIRVFYDRVVSKHAEQIILRKK